MYAKMNNNSIDVQRQEALKRRWHDSFYTRLLTTPSPTPPAAASSSLSLSGKPPHFLQPGRLDGRDLVANVIPSVTVVLEGRSICHRVNLQNHANYHSLAKALRLMFADTLNVQQYDDNDEGNKHLDLSNAIPGHLIAYEDLENDLLLAGDLHWKDFVRVAKRIRVLPVKSNSRKQRSIK